MMSTQERVKRLRVAIKFAIARDILNREDGAGSDLSVAEPDLEGVFIHVEGNLDVSALANTVIDTLIERGVL